MGLRGALYRRLDAAPILGNACALRLHYVVHRLYQCHCGVRCKLTWHTIMGKSRVSWKYKGASRYPLFVVRPRQSHEGVLAPRDLLNRVLQAATERSSPHPGVIRGWVYEPT